MFDNEHVADMINDPGPGDRKFHSEKFNQLSARKACPNFCNREQDFVKLRTTLRF